MKTMKKRGVSEMVNSVLLIIVVITIASLVFAFLKLYVPKEKPTCDKEVFLVIQNYSCSDNIITLSLLNKGLFSVDAVYIRIGPINKTIRYLINSDKLYFGVIDGKKGLAPGKTYTETYSNQLINSEKSILEIQPAIFSKNELALCENAVITQEISCN